MNRSGKHLLLSSLELLLPNHEPFTCSNSTPCPVLADGTGDYPPPPDPVFFDSRYADSMFTSFTTASEPMKSILEYARRLSLYDFPVLIQGESGTQKKLLARAIHKTSSRRQHPFVCLNMPMGLNAAARINGVSGPNEVSRPGQRSRPRRAIRSGRDLLSVRRSSDCLGSSLPDVRTVQRGQPRNPAH